MTQYSYRKQITQQEKSYFKYWKTKIFTNFQNKAMAFGVGTLVSSVPKNVFREDLKT